jgi:hypothetical protein
MFTTTNGDMRLVTNVATAVVNSMPQANVLVLANTRPEFTTGSLVLGIQSGAVAVLDTISRSGVIKDYSTFVNLHKYVGSLQFGIFTENEVVNQGNSAALLHSTRLDSGTLTMYTSNQVGAFQVASTITGNSSAAIMSVTAKYLPELVYGSGLPIHIENLSPIQRTAKQSEVFRVILDF